MFVGLPQSKAKFCLAHNQAMSEERNVSVNARLPSTDGICAILFDDFRKYPFYRTDCARKIWPLKIVRFCAAVFESAPASVLAVWGCPLNRQEGKPTAFESNIENEARLVDEKVDEMAFLFLRRRLRFENPFAWRIKLRRRICWLQFHGEESASNRVSLGFYAI
jgi:hypothetical protein